MPLSASRATRSRETTARNLPLKNGVQIFAGGIVVNDAGKAAPGRTAVGLVAMGRATTDMDNLSGSLDDAATPTEAGCFGFNNSIADPVGDSQVGKEVFIEDDETIAATDGGGTRSPAGICFELEESRVWVTIGK